MEKELGHLFCDHCGALIKRSKYLIHLYKVHNITSYPDEEYIQKKIETHRAEIERQEAEFKIKLENKRKRKRILEINRERRKEEKIQHELFLKSLDVKYSRFTQELSEINDQLYNPNTEKQVRPLIEWLESDRKKTKNIREVLRIEELQKEFSKILEDKRTKKDDFVNSECKSYYITWSDVTFDKDKVHISPDRAFVKPIEYIGSIESLNLIKQDYFSRVFSHAIYKLTFYHGSIDKDLSRDFGKFSNAIELAKEYYHFKFNVKKTSIFKGYEKLSHDQLSKLYSNYFERSQYLKFLAQNQSRQFKIIPIIEYMNGVMEEGFIFRKACTKFEVMIIWENTNEGRATYIFHSKIDEIGKYLRNIETFIINEIDNKRSYIRSQTKESLKVSKQLNLVDTINHTTLQDYKQNFKRISEIISSKR